MTKKKTVTVKLISELSGVSQPVVSAILGRVRNPTVRFSEETRNRVLSVAAEQGYRPNRTARGLHQNRHDMIGLLVSHMFMIPRMTTTWMLQRAAANGQLLAIEHYEAGQEELPVFLREDCVDGIVVFEDFGEPLRREIRRIGIPALWVNTNYETGDDCIHFDEPQGMELAVTRFRELGMKNVLLVHAATSHYSWPQRRDGLTHAATKVGLNVLPPVNPDDNGRRAARDALTRRLLEVLDRVDGPTGVVLASCDYAPPLYAAAARLKRRIPTDLAVIAFHKQSIMNYLKPTLSNLEIETRILANLVIDRLNHLIKGGKQAPGPTRYPYLLRDRESTGR